MSSDIARIRKATEGDYAGRSFDVYDVRTLLHALDQAHEAANTYEADANGRARAWNGHYVKAHYVLITPAKERVLCWPNAGYMNASDGSGRHWAPCADISVERMDLDDALSIVRKERKP